MKKYILQALFIIVFVSTNAQTIARSAAQVDTITTAICLGMWYTVGIDTFRMTGTYTDTLSGAAVGGWDSIVILDLAVYPVPSDTLYDTICSGSAYTYSGHTVSQAGIYTDTLLSIHGCDSLLFIFLTVDTPPVPVITPVGGGVLRCTTPGPATYQWCDSGQALPGQNLYIFYAAQHGLYTVIITDMFGCIDTSAVYRYTGIGETAAADHIPCIRLNPSDGSFILETDGYTGGEYTIYDMAGRQMDRAAITSGSQPIHLFLSDGAYLLVVRSEDGTASALRFEVVR